MFKSKIFTIFFILIGLVSNKLYSVDWTLLTPKPDCLRESDWKGPNEIKVCVRDALTGNPDEDHWILESCDLNCCFRIIFWDRWTGQNKNEYELMVTGIFTSGGNNCENCILQVYSRIFARLLYDRSRVYPNFKQRALSTGRIMYDPNGRPYSWVYTYSIGQCEFEGGRCYWTCCKYYTEIQFWNTDEFIHGFTNYWVPDELIPPCNRTPCTNFQCFQTPIFGEDPTQCPICEGTSWEIMEDEVRYPCYGDEDCVIHIKYRKRNEKNCPDQIEWKDYQLLEFYPLNCENCSLPPDDILHSFVVEWILKYGGHELPQEPGDIQTNWRFIEQGCWTYVNEDGIPKYKECPNNTACCWAQYRVEKTGEGQYEFTPISGTPYIECSDDNCRILCIEPRRIGSYDRENVDLSDFWNIEFFDDEITLKIKNKYKGSVKFVIFDLLGRVFWDKMLIKNSFDYTTVIKIDKLNKGLYFVRFYLDDFNYIVKPIIKY